MIDVSIIIPIYNGAKWLDDCMKSILVQSILKSNEKLEIAVCDDGSEDETNQLLQIWSKQFSNLGVVFKIIRNPNSLGVGAAKNAATKTSTGQFLCFQDIDDLMKPDRILKQLEAARSNLNAIVGSKISRRPPESTPRFVKWANELNPSLLKVQIYTSNGPTLLMPTWFCHRSVFDKVGGFSDAGCGTPEDLIFFYKHLDNGGDLLRVEEELLIYTYHKGATTFSVSRETIRRIQLDRLERHVLSAWNQFTVWNAGKAGRKLVRSLSYESQKKVVAFCDVDIKKIGTRIDLYCPLERHILVSIPVVHFSAAKPPFIICVKLGLTNGEFEANLESLNLIEGKDFIYFN